MKRWKLRQVVACTWSKVEKSSRISKIDGPLNIRKSDCPFRPVISAYDSPTNHLAQHYTKLTIPATHRKQFHTSKTRSTFQVDWPSSQYTTETLRNSFRWPKYPRRHHKLTQRNMPSTYEGQFYKQARGIPEISPFFPVVLPMSSWHILRRRQSLYVLIPISEWPPLSHHW